MNCQLFDRYVFDYCEDRVSPALKDKIEEHLQDCTWCTSQVKLTCLENEFLGDKSDLPSLPEDFTARVMNKVTQSVQAEPAALTPVKANRFKLMDWALSSAVMGLIVLLVLVTPQFLPSFESGQVADQGMKGPAITGSGSKELNGGTLDTNSPPPAWDDSSSPPETPPTAPDSEVQTDSAVPEEPEQQQFNVAMINQVAPPSSFWKADADVPSRMGKNPAPAAEKAGPIAVMLQPDKIPAKFSLEKIVTVEPASVVEYHYADDRSRSLTIRVTSLLQQSKVMSLTSQPPAEYGNAPEIGISSANVQNLEVHYQLTINGQPYEISLNGTLPPEELGRLAESITFAETPLQH